MKMNMKKYGKYLCFAGIGMLGLTLFYLAFAAWCSMLWAKDSVLFYLEEPVSVEEALSISEVCNKVRRSGSIMQFVKDYQLDDGIICSCVRNNIPIVLAGSIRDDGPLPEVIGDVYKAADTMREQVRGATTVICLATMLHTIATGNMTPSFRVLDDGTVRPVYLYTVDADEFVVNKLLDRGSLSATTIVTNVQDFITLVAKGLGVIK